MRKSAVKRLPKLVAAALGAGALTAAVAIASGSPTVSTGGATSVTNTTAVLAGSVNANGATTAYQFVYGPTTAYGATTTAKSAGHGSSSVSVSQALAALTPGTLYHYRISAVNASGAGTGADRTFTTTGHQPAAVVTGAAVSVGKTQATPTGTIDPEGAATQWVVQYGLTTTYGYETFAQILSPVNASVPVAMQLVGLAPATLFHYRIVAYHGATVVSPGQDATFFTEPLIRPQPRLTFAISPSVAAHRPYTFTTSGSVRGNTFIPAAYRCAGDVTVRFYDGRRALAPAVAPVDASCRFTVSSTFTSLRPSAPVRLKVTLAYGATGYLAATRRTAHVTAG